MSSLIFMILVFVFILVQGSWYKKSIFDKIYIQRSFDRGGVFPGDTMVYEYTMENRKMLPMTWVSIDEDFFSGILFEGNAKIQVLNEEIYRHTAMMSLLPYQKLVRRYNLRAVKRGFYQLRYLTMTSTNLLGTEEYTEERETAAAIAVYPKIKDLRGALVPANTTQGDYSVRRWIIEDPMVIVGIRNYSGSDSLKSINWKATAKNQKLLVNKYDFTADKKVMIILNLEHQEYTLRKDSIQHIESALEVSASLAMMLHEAGIPVGFATNAHTVGPVEVNSLDPDTGDKHMSSMLEAMAKVSYFKKYNSRELLKLLVADFSWGTEVIVVTPEVTEEFLKGLQYINHMKTTVITLSECKDRIPPNIELYYYKEEGEHYEVIG